MEQSRKPGGRRPGAGRPRSIETRVVRLPLPVAELAKRWMERGIRAGDVNAFLDVSATREASIPLVNSTASCGFPSPADDHLDRPLDFNELLVHNPSATFAVRVSGESMIKAGIFPGDIAVVDRSRDVSHGCIVLACLDNEFTIKRYLVRAGRLTLHPENPAFRDIEILDGVEFEVWGVVTNSIRMFLAVGALFALVDCNNFYASCERVFQPRLRGRPVVVLSNNDGCVIARSNEAKALGVEMGAPWHLNRDRFEREGVIVRSSNYTLYGDMSARVMRVLSTFAPEMEIYSIDEAFLSVAGFGDRLPAHMHTLRATVLRWTGIPVSVGVAPTKTLAKVANRLAKKTPASGGVMALLDKSSQTAALASLELTDLWGLAGRLAVRLRQLEITTPLQLRDADPKFIRAHFGVVMERMVLELRGISCLALEEHFPDRKTIMASRSFGRPVTDLNELKEAVASYVSRAAEKMRRQDLVTVAIQVFAHTNRFKPGDPQYSGCHTVHLPIATADTGRLIKAALHGVTCFWKPSFSYKKAGVVCLDLHRADRVQAALFHQPDNPGRVELMRVLDELNRKFGRDRVAYASAGIHKAWKLRSDHHSPRYTTSWKELLVV